MPPEPSKNIINNPPNPTHLAFQRLYYLTEEGALDEECHLWEAWANFIRRSSDPDRIIPETTQPESSELDEIWADVAFGFKMRRLKVCGNVLEVLGALTFPKSKESHLQLHSALMKARRLETEILQIVTRISKFRQFRGHDTKPTIWEILSDTFDHDLHLPHNAAAHDLDWGYSDDENELSGLNSTGEDSDNDETANEADIPEAANPLKNIARRTVAHAPLLFCPQSGCTFRITGQGDLRRHFGSHTQGNPQFHCLFCPFKTVYFRRFRKHGPKMHGINCEGPIMLEMAFAGSKRLEKLLRTAQGLKDDDFKTRIWI